VTAVALFVHNSYILHSPLVGGVNGAWNGITNTLYIMHTVRTQGYTVVISYQAGFT
jgi:hypothetical protein